MYPKEAYNFIFTAKQVYITRYTYKGAAEDAPL